MIARVAAIVIALCGAAAADHAHDHGGEPAPAHSLAAAISVLAASYESMLFGGDYEGVGGSLRWARGRFGAAAGVTTYRLTKNGKTIHGVGDAVASGQAALYERGPVSTGVALALGAPTGDELAGLGMGHFMVMSAGWASYARNRVQVSGSLGYHHGIGDASVHAAHNGGAWPLVDPMNYSEVTAGAGVAYALARPLRAGLRLTGAAPTGAGDARLVGGVRAVWIAGRLENAFELEAGLAGDPFRFRGVLETAIRFE